MTELIDYSDYRDDILRITHTVQFLEQVPNQKPENPPERWTQKVKEQVRKRKKVAAGLETEIRELEELIE